VSLYGFRTSRDVPKRTAAAAAFLDDLQQLAKRKQLKCA